LEVGSEKSKIFIERMGTVNDKKKVERFEDLVAWQKARKFSAEIF